MNLRPPLVLASASPRRRELLASIGVPAEVAVTGVEEPADGSLPPETHALVAARAKARSAVMANVGRLVLAADTVVALGERGEDVLGKPRDDAHALAMLAALSGRTHEVLTAVVLAHAGSSAETTVRTRVTFRSLPPSLAQRLALTGETRDKAGAYAIQGRVATHVERLDGSWSNVVGLPLEALPGLFEQLGLNLSDWQDW